MAQWQQAGSIGAAAGVNAEEHDALDAPAPGEAVRQWIDAQHGPPDTTVLDKIGHDPVDRVDRNREADTGRSTARTVDQGVDTDQPARAVEQRSTRIAGVDGSVSLNDVFDRRLIARRDGPADGADDTRREGLIETEGIADREDGLADEEVLRAADRQRPEAVGWCFDLEHR